MVNAQKVLEHIAQTTNNPVEVVNKSVKIEYWKDMVNFAGSDGLELFSGYITKLNLNEIKPLCGGLGIELPITLFHPEYKSRDNVKFYLDKMYSGIFREKYKENFNFR